MNHDNNERRTRMPPQHQDRQPGIESEMHPKPESDDLHSQGSNKLRGKVALITGGDSGIGKAVAIAFAKEGADVFINYLNEHKDAHETKKIIEEYGVECALFPCDISEKPSCQLLIDNAIERMGQLDILVNNAGVQYPQASIEDITVEQLEKTFKVNFFSYIYLTQAALPYLNPGAKIINTTSITAYRGSKRLIDYSSTKGAIVSFTRSLSEALIEQRIRVNAVAPGPIWTPLIPASFSETEVHEFGASVPMNRPGQPAEIAACYVFLASDDSSYMTGQVLHPNGGVIVNG